MTATNYTPHALRIQRKRIKGWKMPPGAIYVGRPTMWGNPFESVARFRQVVDWCKGDIDASCAPATDEQCKRVSDMLRRIGHLRGKQLACWCGLDCECHADVLCELANTIAAGEQRD